jgi:hypothetical protein
VQRYLRRWGHRLVLHYLPTYYYSVTKMERQGLLVSGDSRDNAAGRGAAAGRG